MRKMTLAVAALVAGVATLVTTSAAVAVDYTEPVVNVTGGSAAGGVVGPGEEFTLEGDFGGTECDPWTSTFEGQEASGSGTTFSVTYTAPTEPGEYFVFITCTYEDGAETSSSVGQSFFFEAEVDLAPIRIVVEGDGAAGDGAQSSSDSAAQSGILPGTGGSNLLLLVAGGALVLIGAGVVLARRRAS